ncbi:MAG: sensor domain-containing diguanylate cyclase [Lachnospiraceae bacterium]|nr:sensor domain-containing diguanylate cyclase [Lachnospiraceae bacterium]
MDLQTWIESFTGYAGLYSFDIMEDGSFGEILLMAVNARNKDILHLRPDAPEFHPGTPYREYWMDLNFERFVYICGSEFKALYSYVFAHEFWLKGFYIPVTAQWDTESCPPPPAGAKRVYCLYIASYSKDVETEFMPHRSSDVSNAVMDIGIRLHESRDFYKSMTSVARQIREFCGAERCSLYTVDKGRHECSLINERGLQNEFMETLAADMGRTPYETAEAWERILDGSDCLLLEDLTVIEERDPAWHRSLITNGIRNMILYSIRSNRELVGYIWVANYTLDRINKIKETLELSTFILGAVIENHQLLSRLEIKSTMDELTQVGNRNAMNDFMNAYTEGKSELPETMGVVFADLNGLKRVNDRYGHEAGDKLLTRAAALIKIAFGDDNIFRAGGDEFVIFCPGITEAQMNERVMQLKGLAINTSDVSFACGSIHCRGDYDINAAVREADERMYEDKKEYYRYHPDKDRRK